MNDQLLKETSDVLNKKRKEESRDFNDSKALAVPLPPPVHAVSTEIASSLPQFGVNISSSTITFNVYK